MSEHKSDLVERIKRRLGYPIVKIELDAQQIEDNIDYARNKFRKWAAGQATIDRYYTLLLSGGKQFYDMPSTCVEFLGYDHRVTGSIHTLFTVENYLYNAGLYDQMMMRGGANNYTLVSYHIARDFLDTVKRYVISAYNGIYHRYTNQLEISPIPPTGGSMSFTISGSNVVLDSPGLILIHLQVLEGTDEDLYGGSDWIFDYALALTKISLGRVRSKFANYAAVGSNVGLALDGDTLLSEGQADIERLEVTLREEEVWDSCGEILIG